MSEAKRAKDEAERGLAEARAGVVRPRQKKVAVTFVVHLECDVPEDWDDNLIAFSIEENSCVGNIVNQLHREMQVEPNVCKLCDTRALAFVGHIPLAKIGALRT